MGPDQVHWQLRLSVGWCWRGCGVRREELWWLQWAVFRCGLHRHRMAPVNCIPENGEKEDSKGEKAQEESGKWGCSGREGVGELRKRSGGWVVSGKEGVGRGGGEGSGREPVP